MPMSIVGTPSTVAGRSAAMRSSIRQGSEYGGRIIVPRVTTAPSTDITHPAVWNSGMALSWTLPGPRPRRAVYSRALLTMPR
jgi:hypothetical protein